MELSRRRMLALAPAITTLAACGISTPRPRVNVRDHGAVGDGVTDDSAAIVAATAALKPGHTLFFPSGSYRFARLRPDSRAAISISGISDVVVEFSSNAELLMDNLDGGAGTSHAILVSGPASGITLRNVKIRWKTTPTRRSFGDGVRIIGFPAEGGSPPSDWTASRGPVTDVRVLDCEVRSSPQTGMIMVGVSGIRIDGLSVRDTRADGLHFNACRRAKIHNHTALNTGDDGLAVVTYYADRFAYDTRAQTFSFPELNDWTGADFDISNVKIAGGSANGIRLSGANGVNIRWLTVTGKSSGAGLIADTAAPGAEAGWNTVASRGVRLTRARIERCDIGIHVLARTGSAVDRRFTDFDFDARELEITDCTNWGVCFESISGQALAGARFARCVVEATATTGGNGGVGLANVDGAQLKKVSVSHASPLTVFSARNSTGLVAADMEFAITGPARDGAVVAPCAILENSDGRIDGATVRWPEAPESWQPVRVVAAGLNCASPPRISVSGLRVEPSVTEPLLTC